MTNTYPYVEAHHQGLRQRRPSAILLKPTWTTSDTGAAYGIAMAQHRRGAPHDTAHFVVDSSTIYQCVPAKTIAGHEHCSTKNLLSISVCFDPSETQYGWDSKTHQDLLENLSELVAQLTVEYKIRPVWLDAASFKRWTKMKTRSRGGLFAQMEGPWPLAEFNSTLMQKRKEYRG